MNVVVVIPVFNGSRTIRRAVESVLAQTSSAEVSIFCIDDFSTDGSFELMRELAADIPSMHVERNPRNLGVSVTRNRAIAATQQELIAFLDQDDAWVADKLERQIAALSARPEVGYVVGPQQFTVDEGATRPPWVRPEWLQAPLPGFVPGALLVRRSTFDELGAFDEEMRIGGDDTDWFARARRRSVPFVNLENVVLVRYVHGQNLSSNTGTGRELLNLVRRHVSDQRGAS